jgi:hypothetical protein
MDILLPDPAQWRSLMQDAPTPTSWESGNIWIYPEGEIGDGDARSDPLDWPGCTSPPGVFADSTWYRVVIAADLANSLKIYVNGTQVASITDGLGVDGWFSLYPNTVSFFADAYGYDGPVICDSLAYWNQTLTDAQVASMGDTSSPMRVVPEPATMSLLAIGGLALLRRNRK